MDEAEVVAELYALVPGDFTRVRNERAAQARAAGDPALSARIKQLRRPTASAWALNQLVRERPQDVNDLLAVGARMREAQTTLAGDALRELGRERRAVIAALARAARSVAAGHGQRLSAAAESEVEDTLNAALVDPSAGFALRSGQLTNPLSYVGMGPMSAAAADASLPEGVLASPALAEAAAPPDVPAARHAAASRSEGGGDPVGGPLLWPVLDDRGAPDAPDAAAGVRSNGKPAVVTVAPAPGRSAPGRSRGERSRAERSRPEEVEEARRRRELERAREDRQEAERGAADAATALREAQAGVEDAMARRRELDERVDQLHEELRVAEEEAMRAAKDVLDARHARDSAARNDMKARRLADRARAEVERLDS